MFAHLLKYSLKMLVKNRGIMFWFLVFPVILGTFFHLLLARSFELEKEFDAIPVAVVVQSGAEDYSRLLREAATDQGTVLLRITETTDQRAQELLEKGEVKGIVYAGDSLSLTVAESGSVPTMLQLIIKRVEQCRRLSIPCTVEGDPVTEKGITEGAVDSSMNFKYALIALACLLASLMGFDRVVKGYGSISGPGMRKKVSPVGWGRGILADFLACQSLGYGVVCFIFVYMRFVLGSRMGDHFLLILLLLFVAVSSGILMGMFFALLPIRQENIRLTVLIGVVLGCCAMGDLMIEGIYDSIEHSSVAWLNDINPAGMIRDALYSLNVYGGYSRFWMNVGRLGAVAAAFTLACLIMGRGKRYAGL